MNRAARVALNREQILTETDSLPTAGSISARIHRLPAIWTMLVLLGLDRVAASGSRVGSARPAPANPAVYSAAIRAGSFSCTTSNRSAFITLFQAATKSRANLPCESADP